MIADPKTYAPPLPPKEAPEEPIRQSDFLSAMKLMLSELRGGTGSAADKDRLALEAERMLLEHERLKREMPENKQPPGISVYSYPEGDLVHPKPPLKCKMFWVGYELKSDTLTPLEVELLNRLTPGEYKVTKTDGTAIPFRVSAKYTDSFKLDELAVQFPCKEEQKHNHAGLVSYCQQALGDVIPSTTELMAELTRLRAELAAAGSVH